MNVYSALSNDDRRAIVDHLFKARGVASNRMLANLIGKSEEWTRAQLVMLADAGLITRSHGPGAADPVRNAIVAGVVWPISLSVERCRVLAITGRPIVMDYLAQAGQSTVSDIVKAIGISQSQASKHLKALVGVGLVHREHRDSNSFWHSIADGVVWPVKVRT